MNGGAYSIRGYLFQYLICILDSLQENWRSVIIEPDSNHDKVDILWFIQTDQGFYKKSVQVKSTQNHFEKPEVEWIAKNLKNDLEADNYELILIGQVTGPVIKDKKEIEQCGVKIPYPKVFDLDAFLSQACHKLDKYIEETYSIRLPWHQREELVYSLIGELQYYSTQRREITREDFENKLQEWIRYFIDYTNYEREESRKFYNSYGFEASLNLRTAIEKFVRNKSRKVKIKFFKECQSFLDVDLTTKNLKIIYPKFERISYYVGNILLVTTTILTLLCLILAVYFQSIFFILFFIFGFLVIGILPLIRPDHFAKIIDRELK